MRAIEESVLKGYADTVQKKLELEPYYALAFFALLVIAAVVVKCYPKKQRRPRKTYPDETPSDYEDEGETEGTNDDVFVRPDPQRPRNALSFLKRAKVE